MQGTDEQKVISSMLVPFALEPEREGYALARWRECPGPRRRAFLLMAGFMVLLGSGLVAAAASGGPTVHSPAVLWLTGAAVLLCAAYSVWIAVGNPLPYRKIEYHVLHGRIRVRVYLGRGRSRQWRSYAPQEWSVRLRAVELVDVFGRGPGWKGWAVVLHAGPEVIPLACSQSRERVQQYADSLPFPPDRLATDPEPLRARALFGGNLEWNTGRAAAARKPA